MNIKKRLTFQNIVLWGLISLSLIIGIVSNALFSHENPPRADMAFTNSPNQETPVFTLMYHQMLKNESSLGTYIISPDEFELDLKYLSENNFTPLLPRELAEIVEKKEGMPEKPVVITFDDGHETALDYVLPLLKKYNMKAEINIVGVLTDEYSGYSDEEKSLSYSYLTWDEIKKLEESGVVEIGNHTYDMHCNTWERVGCKQKKTESDVEYKNILTKDLSLLQEKIKQNVGITPVTFAYPYGLISEPSLEVVKNLDFKVLLTCREEMSYISYGQEFPIYLNRFNREHNRSAESIYESL